MSTLTSNIFKTTFLSFILFSSLSGVEQIKRYVIERIDNTTILLNVESGASWRFTDNKWVKILRYEDQDLELIELDNIEEDFGFVPFDDQ